MRVAGDVSSKSEVARDLRELVVRRWGPQVAGSLQSQIEETSEWIYLICNQPLDIWSDEPDFLTSRNAYGRQEDC